MLKHKFISCALLALSQSVFAQQAPHAGSQLQQIPPSPVPQKVAPQVEVKQGIAPAIAATEGAKINVKRLDIVGAQIYSAAELLTVSGFKPASDLTLANLRSMAAKISNHYHQNGYFVAQAYLPAQGVKDGVVTITVIEGRYGKVTLNNQSGLAAPLANNILGGLNAGDPIESAPLENRLLLLSDLPGINVKSTLLPGVSPGTSDLVVDLTPGRSISGSIDADNAGNRHTGEYRVGATVNLNNPTGNGDVATLRALTSGSGLNYARAAYQMQFGKATAGVAYSAMKYELSRDQFDGAGFNGTAQIASIFGRYPLLRSRNSNLSVGLAYDAKRLEDKVHSTTYSDRHADVLTGSLHGDHRDGLGGGGFSSYSLAWSTGNLNIRTPTVRAFDAATAHSNGHYNKLGFHAMRLQRITASTALYAGINGQLASKNLDSSEKMELGGMYGVRAYPEGEAYADTGYLLNLEARMQLPKFSEQQMGQLQLIGFVDTGSVTTNKNPWLAGSNHRTLSGVGVGLNWSDTNNYTVRAYYAHKLGNAEATSAPDRSGRFWIQAVKYF